MIRRAWSGSKLFAKIILAADVTGRQRVKEVEGLYNLCNINKGAGQLHDVCTYVFTYAKKKQKKFPQEVAQKLTIFEQEI